MGSVNAKNIARHHDAELLAVSEATSNLAKKIVGDRVNKDGAAMKIVT